MEGEEVCMKKKLTADERWLLNTVEAIGSMLSHPQRGRRQFSVEQMGTRCRANRAQIGKHLA
jgi:hypothetical protein